MSTLCHPFNRTLVTPRCTFKLYSGSLPDRTVRGLRGLALAWISDPTAGFVRTEDGSSILSVFWWEEHALRRLRYDPCAPSRRPFLDALTVASVDELPVLAFESASWTRHVVRGCPPSIPSYLAEFHT
jgi:hypothetical protein